MVNLGIVRKIDGLGRVVIAKEVRKIMGLDEGEAVEMFTEGEFIMLRKYQPACVFCGEASGVSHFKGKNVCEQCLHEMRE